MPTLLRAAACSVLSLSISTSFIASQETATTKSTVDPGLFAEMQYRCVGPSRGGRVTTVAGVAQRPGEFYMGATGGGVWKTTNFGKTWRNVSDGFFTTPSIGAIRVAPSNPDVVYVGTGSDGLRSNVITGKGLYKSLDAGKTWHCMGLEKVGQIGAVEVHPSDPDIAYVAAIGQAFQSNRERGVYRTRDGGKHWQLVLFVSDKIGVVDLELNTANPDEIYASTWRAERKPWTIISGATGCGVQKSTDGGATWHKLTKGLPTGVVGKSDLAVSRDDPNRLYVLIEAADGGSGVYRSNDRGSNFERVSTNRGLIDRPFYYCNIDADPNDADLLFVNSTRFYRSKDGGAKWRTLSTPHGDNHDIWIHPENSKLMVQCNDGGANVSIDGGSTWSTQSNQPTAELYQVNVDDRFPYWLYAGQQDNSTIRVPSSPPFPAPGGISSYWQSIGGCETGPAIPKRGDANIVYANCKGRFGRFNFRTGQEKQFYVGAANMYGHDPKNLKYRFQRVAPIALSPHDGNVVYHASQFLHRSTDEGENWETISPDLTAFDPDTQGISGSPITRDITGEEFYSTIYAIAESPIERGVIWVGANDGPIHVTRDGGKTWRKVTPPNLAKGGRVQTVEPSPHKAGKCYVCVLRYQLGDWRPHVYRTENYGKSWKRITTGVPDDSPARVVREDPAREGLLYLGTEFGLHVSFDDGAHWQPFQLNLPVTPISDMKVHQGDLVLSTMGRSFWILDDLSRLHQLDGSIDRALHVFEPRATHRARFARSRGSSGVRYLAAAATIDYRLGKDANDVVLEILDAKGKIIRRVKSRERRRPGEKAATAAAADKKPRGDGMRPTFRRPTARLSTKAGAHRYRWDLRHDGPVTPRARRRSGGGRRPQRARARTTGRGPMVAPGRYTARLIASGETRTVEFDVRIDPRVAADSVTQADLDAQEQLALQVRDTMTRAKALAAKVKRALRKDPKDPAAKKCQDELVTPKGRYMRPRLIDQISYLSKMIDAADQRPGKDAYVRIAELNAWLERISR